MNPLRTLRSLVFSLGCLALMWLIGLFFFVAAIHRYTEPTIEETEPADAIVVLTGGSERLQTGLDLLTAGKGKKLFVSGVHPGLNAGHLLAKQTARQELRDCCIVLGYAAADTVGNADETALWMKQEGFSSLLLVTSHYHMLRSLLLFRKAMPDALIVPHPVTPDRVKLADWWNWPGTSSLLVTEYNKYLIAVVHIMLRSGLETTTEALS